MSDSSGKNIIEEIQEMNFSYLNLAKKMISLDKEEAITRMGISNETADLIESMTNTQLMKFSRSNQLIPKLGHVEKALIKTVVTQNNEYIPHKFHSAIILSSVAEV